MTLILILRDSFSYHRHSDHSCVHWAPLILLGPLKDSFLTALLNQKLTWGLMALVTQSRRPLIYDQHWLGTDKEYGRILPPVQTSCTCCFPTGPWHVVLPQCTMVSNNPVTRLYCFLSKAITSLDTLSEGLQMNSFDCLIPGVVAQHLECLCFSHSLTWSCQHMMRLKMIVWNWGMNCLIPS